MGGGGHHGPPKVPDYKIYKVENVPELVALRRVLAAQGLKDPWLRNEVWKYGGVGRETKRQILRNTIGRGMKVGFGLAVLTTIVGKLLEKNDPGHGHH